jgi:pimeloyl-ACP methyl ester carboxylesterase
MTAAAYAEAVLLSHDLVLLHGQPGLGSDWRQVLARLPAGVRAVAPDRPGYGSSRQPAGGFEANARAVLADLDRRHVERAVLVGHSYGGGVALTVAALAPDRVRALVLLASVGPGCLNGWDRLLAAPVAGPVCSLFAWKLTPWFARARLRRLAGRRGSGSAQFEPEQHVNWFVWGHSRREHGPLWRSFLAEQRALVREAGDLAAVAASVGVPVLLIADPADTMVPVRTARELERALPDTRLRLVDGSGHHLPMRAASLVAGAIGSFLSELGSGGRPVAENRADRG